MGTMAAIEDKQYFNKRLKLLENLNETFLITFSRGRVQGYR